MSDNFDRTNSGALFPNDRKNTDKHPDLTGKVDINGTEYYLSGWHKTSRSGGEFISLAIGKAVEAKPNAPTARRSPPVRSSPRPARDDFDDIPL